MSIGTPFLALALLTGLGARPSLCTTAGAQPARAVEASPVQERAPLGAVFACYRHAKDDTRLGESSIAELCSGAADAAPVDCYLDARNRTRLADDDAIALCRCAISTEPVACFEQGRRTTTIDSGRILSMCAPSQHFELDATCTPASR